MTANATDPPLASQGRRLAGAVLDGLIFVLTLGIGWVTYRHRNSPRPEPRSQRMPSDL